jgi:hypothetical protein
MPLTQLETELLRVARDRIEREQLPRTVPRSMWGGNGSGRPCALCDQSIRPEEMELEVEQPIRGQARAFQFHVVCQSLWQLECARDDLRKKLPNTAP